MQELNLNSRVGAIPNYGPQSPQASDSGGTRIDTWICRISLLYFGSFILLETVPVDNKIWLMLKSMVILRVPTEMIDGILRRALCPIFILPSTFDSPESKSELIRIERLKPTMGIQEIYQNILTNRDGKIHSDLLQDYTVRVQYQILIGSFVLQWKTIWSCRATEEAA